MTAESPVPAKKPADPAEVAAWLQSEGQNAPALLCIDTNVDRGGHTPKLLGAVASLNHASRELRRGDVVVLVVPALVWSERARQERWQRGAAYNDEAVRNFARDNEHVLKVVDFTADDGLRAAEQLVRWYPTREVWNGRRHATPVTDPAGPAGSSNVDDLLAAYVASLGTKAMMVTTDSGPEWRFCPRCLPAVALQALEEAAKKLRDALATQKMLDAI